MNNYLRYFLYVLGFSVSSEVIYQLVDILYKKNFETKKDEEVNDVLFINELIENCEGIHGNDIIPCYNLNCYMKNIQRIIMEIENAKQNIDVAMYIFTMYEFSSALIQAQKRGISVRVICDNTMSCNDASKIIDLYKEGCQVRNGSKDTTMHHKFCIIDGPRTEYSAMIKPFFKLKIKPTPLLITGSANWTIQGFCGNWENILITSNNKIINKFQNEFDRLWESKEFGKFHTNGVY